MLETKTLFTIPISDLQKETSPRKNRINRDKSPHFCPPGAGHWGMVKMAFLVPEISILFVIPMGCGRHGGIAAMKEGISEKLSYLPITEVDIVTGDHLDKVENAVAEVIESELPKGLMLFTTCIDDLLGSDYENLIIQLEKRYGVPIVHAKMNPIMALSKKPPEVMIYNSLHGFLKKGKQQKGIFNVLGTPCPIDPDSEIHKIMDTMGMEPLQHIGNYKDFKSYLTMNRAEGNLVIGIQGLRAAQDLNKRLNQTFVSIYSVFRPEGITKNYKSLFEYLEKDIPLEKYKEQLEDFLACNRQFLKGKTAVIGTTLQAAPFELARFLTEMGMEVRYITAGLIRPYEKEHIPWLEKNAPQISVIPSVEPSLSMVEEPIEEIDYAFGMDTPAYFKARHLIDISVQDNLYGYEGTKKLVQLILEAPAYNMSIKELVYSQNLVI